MKNLFSIFVIIFTVALFSCSDKDVSTAAKSNPETIPRTAEATLAPSENILRDTNPPRRSNMIVSTARQKNKINSTFPFDISMTNAKKEVLNSET